eukprot:6460909-Amphidinium_carterae.2
MQMCFTVRPHQRSPGSAGPPCNGEDASEAYAEVKAKLHRKSKACLRLLPPETTETAVLAFARLEF